MNKKILVFLYLIIFFLILIIFSKFNIKIVLEKNLSLIDELKSNNFLLLILISNTLSTIISFCGFSLPVVIFNGIVFGNLIGFFNSLFSLTLGSYIFYVTYFNSSPKKIFDLYQKKFSRLEKFTSNNQFISFFLIRFFGFGLPFIIHNYFGIFLKIRKSTFILASLLGMIPLSLQSLIADGLFEIIFKDKFSLSLIMKDFRILIPLIILILLSIIALLINKLFIKK